MMLLKTKQYLASMKSINCEILAKYENQYEYEEEPQQKSQQ